MNYSEVWKYIFLEVITKNIILLTNIIPNDITTSWCIFVVTLILICILNGHGWDIFSPFSLYVSAFWGKIFFGYGDKIHGDRVFFYHAFKYHVFELLLVWVPHHTIGPECRY